MAIGTVDAVVIAEVTGIAMTSAIGSITTIANADVIVTGQQLTLSLGADKITAWQEIDPGVNNSWTQIATGVSNTWTEVDIAA